jgi:hypothetical protein
MAKNKIYIPTFISSIDYKPARVLPHIYFYNGVKTCDNYYVESLDATGSIQYHSNAVFPYFDNYEGSTPSSGSRSLLFNNETAAYGDIPTGSLYSEYWETYVNLLYNPRTRLFDCSAIIPLADYFKMELNDIVEWRGNYYHLRAINNYNLSNGECQLQLLGPVIGDVIANQLPGIPCSFDYSIEDYTPEYTIAYSMSLCPEVGATLEIDYSNFIVTSSLIVTSSGNGLVNAGGNGSNVFSAFGDSPWPTSGSLVVTASLNGVPFYSASTFNSSSTLSTLVNGVDVEDGGYYLWDVKTVCPFVYPTGSGYKIVDCETGLTTYNVTFSGAAPSASFISSELGVGCWFNSGSITGDLDYTNVVVNHTYTDCEECLTPSQCRTYVNNTSVVWLGDYYDCVTSQWVFNDIIYPYSSICAGQGSPITREGFDLTPGTLCNL